MSTRRKASKKSSAKTPARSKKARKPSKSAARGKGKGSKDTRGERRKKMRFLVGDISAVRGTLARLSRSYFEGDVSEHELRVLTYSLRSVGGMMLMETEKDLDKRLSALEDRERERGVKL